jgi:glycerol-3-phosphate dehydrogenase subunit C
MRDEYPHILEVDNADVREQIMLATKYIFELVDEGKVKLALKKDYKKRIAYHTPCHMEKLGWSIYSTSLIRMIPGVDFVMLDSQCCGIAGTYGFKKENYPYSQKIGEALFKQIQNLKVDLVATDCETCKWQIEMSAGVAVENPISILADALDVEATEQLNKH